jgi:hypothetical protein
MCKKTKNATQPTSAVPIPSATPPLPQRPSTAVAVVVAVVVAVGVSGGAPPTESENSSVELSQLRILIKIVQKNIFLKK